MRSSLCRTAIYGSVRFTSAIAAAGSSSVVIRPLATLFGHSISLRAACPEVFCAVRTAVRLGRYVACGAGVRMASWGVFAGRGSFRSTAAGPCLGYTRFSVIAEQKGNGGNGFCSAPICVVGAISRSFTTCSTQKG